jgi:hypothetical protein
VTLALLEMFHVLYHHDATAPKRPSLHGSGDKDTALSGGVDTCLSSISSLGLLSSCSVPGLGPGAEKEGQRSHSSHASRVLEGAGVALGKDRWWWYRREGMKR